MEGRPASAGRPGTQLLWVAYGPDVPYPVPCDLEREHRHGDAILLSHQPWLAVDRALQERGVAEHPVGDFDPGARDLLAAFDGAQERSGEAAAVGGRRGARVEQADEGTYVLGFPCLLEGPDDAGLLGCRTRWRLRRANAAAGGGRQLAARRRGTPHDLGHLGEGVAEDIVQDER